VYKNSATWEQGYAQTPNNEALGSKRKKVDPVYLSVTDLVLLLFFFRFFKQSEHSLSTNDLKDIFSANMP